MIRPNTSPASIFDRRAPYPCREWGIMSVVTIAEAWPAAGRPFIVAELDRMPDDGRRYELLNGAVVVSPRPTTIHQFVAMRLLRALADACPKTCASCPSPPSCSARKPSSIPISWWSA